MASRPSTPVGRKSRPSTPEGRLKTPDKQTSTMNSVANLEAEPEAPVFSPENFPTPADAASTAASLRNVGRRRSGEAGRISQSKVAIQTATNSVRRSSRNRTSISQVADNITNAAARRYRRISSLMPDAAKNLLVDEMYPMAFPVLDDKCKSLQKKVALDRMFLLSTTKGTKEELVVFVSQHENATMAFPPQVTGFCMVYSEFIISVFEGTAVKLQKILKLLNSAQSLLKETRILYENFDIPDRLCTTIQVHTLPNLDDQPPKPDAPHIVDIQLLLKLVVDKVVQFGLTISQFNKADPDLLSKQIIVASNRAIIYVDQFRTLLQTELLFPIPDYLCLVEGVLDLEGLGGDFHWAYATAPTRI